FCVKCFEDLLAILSKQRWGLRRLIFYPHKPYRRKIDKFCVERIKRRLMNLVLRVVATVDPDTFAVDVFNVEIFFPTVGRLYLFQNFSKLTAKFIKLQRCTIILRYIK